MSQHFRKVMSQKSDKELKTIVENSSHYSEAALAAVLEQIKERKIETPATKDLEKQLESSQRKEIDRKKQAKAPIDLHPNIKRASTLLIISIILGILNSFIIQKLDVPAEMKDVIIPFFSWLLTGFLAYSLRLGAEMSRTIVAVLIAIGTVLSAGSINLLFELHPFLGIISVLQLGVNVFVLVFLFKSETDRWYESRRKEKNDGSKVKKKIEDLEDIL